MAALCNLLPWQGAVKKSGGQHIQFSLALQGNFHVQPVQPWGASHGENELTPHV